jgi:hypothetical protein
MTEEIKQLLIDCANFIQPYDDGGNEAERLMIRLDEALKQGETLPIDSVSESVQLDADDIIAFLNDCETLYEAKMFADEHLR